MQPFKIDDRHLSALCWELAGSIIPPQNPFAHIFNDMQKIFDSTVLHLTCKMDQEIKKLKHQYESKLNEQKIIVTAFEKKFSYFITGRIERLE